MFDLNRYGRFAAVAISICAALLPNRTAADTVGYWRFEEGSGASLHNSATDIDDGTTNGSFSDDVPFEHVPRTGHPNNWSGSFGGGTYATFTGDCVLHQGHGEATVEFTIKGNVSSHQSILWTRIGDDDKNRFNLYINPGGGIGFDYRDVDGNILHLMSFSIPVDDWTHVAIIRTVGPLGEHYYKAYVDGVEAATATDSAPDLPNSAGWSVGGRSGYTLNALIDEIRFSDAALEPSQFLNAGQAVLTGVSLLPMAITGGKQAVGTVTIESESPNDQTVLLQSSHPSIALVDPSVTIPAGETSATFALLTSAVATDTAGTITATLDATSKEAAFVVTPTALTSVTVGPSTVIAGKTVTVTVKLTKLAPAGGYRVFLASENAAAVVPAYVDVLQATSSAKITFKAGYPASTITGPILASFGGTTKQAGLTVKPLEPVSVTLTPSTLYGGGKVTAKVSLNSVAPVGGAAISIACTNSAATCPDTLVIAAGKSFGTFTITTVMPSSTQTGDVTATLNGVSKSALLTVKYGIPTKVTLAFVPNQASYVRGTAITLQATLKDGALNLLSGKTVTFKEYDVSTGARIELGSVLTNASGKATLPYTIPTDTAKTNIKIEAYFLGDGDYMPATKASKAVVFAP